MHPNEITLTHENVRPSSREVACASTIQANNVL